ncbi:MAG: hypothetical protein V9F00_09350 [Nocardioides sp.]
MSSPDDGSPAGISCLAVTGIVFLGGLAYVWLPAALGLPWLGPIVIAAQIFLVAWLSGSSISERFSRRTGRHDE